MSSWNVIWNRLRSYVGTVTGKAKLRRRRRRVFESDLRPTPAEPPNHRWTSKFRPISNRNQVKQANRVSQRLRCLRGWQKCTQVSSKSSHSSGICHVWPPCKNALAKLQALKHGRANKRKVTKKLIKQLKRNSANYFYASDLRRQRNYWQCWLRNDKDKEIIIIIIITSLKSMLIIRPGQLIRVTIKRPTQLQHTHARTAE